MKPTRVRKDLFCGAVFLWLLAAGSMHAHPVPQRNHDRVVVVRLMADAVVVDYHLEVDEFTVVFVDLPARDEKLNLTGLKPREIYDRFTELYAPVLADSLDAHLDGQPLKFSCVERRHRVLDSVQCDFKFRAPWQPPPEQRHQFTFHEGTYVFPDRGQVNVSLTHTLAVVLLNKIEAAPSLKALPYTQLKLGEEDRLRDVRADFTIPTVEPRGGIKPDPLQGMGEPRAEYRSNTGAATPPRAEVRTAPSGEAAVLKMRPRREEEGSSRYALRKLLDSQRGFWILLLLACGFGGAHALTPGHGKTLVAAYLVGERGTVWHALLLGVVTTLTHTGAVLVLAAVLLFLPTGAIEGQVQMALGLVGGLLVAGMGFWLLLRRLSGGADHIHLGGHGHPHHPAGLAHDEHDHLPALPARGVEGGWKSLLVLGITGGIVPCWDAILMLGFAISTRRLWLGLPLLLAFSAGLAGVLIAIGIAVVSFKGVAGARLSENRLFRALPLISAVLVTGLGVWLCYDSLHAGPAGPAGMVQRDSNELSASELGACR